MDRGEWGVIIDVFVNTCGEFYTQNIYFLYSRIRIEYYFSFFLDIENEDETGRKIKIFLTLCFVEHWLDQWKF